MKNKAILLTAVGMGLFVLASAVRADQQTGKQDGLASLVGQAVSTDENVAARAIVALRSRGPAGMDALIATNLQTIKVHQSGMGFANDARSWSRLCAALDGVSAQHDSYASGLFWYTNFDEAKAAARASGKPILSLRLLGRLDEDCSCANSRFFRTTLYANAEVSRYLHDHFILHWKSVRPVPRITVDFGDGRKIERTVTGNSIHYILASDGHPIDALPGLYASKMFLQQLLVAEKEAITYAADKSPNRDDNLRNYHVNLVLESGSAFAHDLALVDRTPAVRPVALNSLPTAVGAGARAISKGKVERPLLNSFNQVDDATWVKVAALHRGDAILDDSAVSLIRAKTPSAKEAAPRAMTKAAPENPLIRTIMNLQRSISEDTVRNEYSLHATIHEWFANQTAPQNLDRLNAKVYAELFLTPDSDPWLGLVPANTFTGLADNGLVCPPN
jgi:hypothetical protein